LASFLLFLLFLGLFLFPIAIYCTVLGMINRRPTPLPVSGAWDFAGLILAVSGFLLFFGPYLLSGGFRQSMRDLPLRGDGHSVADVVGELWASWWVVWVLYYLAVLGGASYLIWSRRLVTVVYNIQADPLESALRLTAERLGLAMNRQGNHLYFEPVASNAAAPVDERIAAGPPPSVAGHLQRPRATISHPLGAELEPFPLMCNVAIHWLRAQPIERLEFERELRKILDQTVVLDSAVGGWLLGIGGFIFILITVATGVIIFAASSIQRR
jgi:hypothetical protein